MPSLGALVRARRKGNENKDQMPGDEGRRSTAARSQQVPQRRWWQRLWRQSREQPQQPQQPQTLLEAVRLIGKDVKALGEEMSKHSILLADLSLRVALLEDRVRVPDPDPPRWRPLDVLPPPRHAHSEILPDPYAKLIEEEMEGQFLETPVGWGPGTGFFLGGLRPRRRTI